MVAMASLAEPAVYTVYNIYDDKWKLQILSRIRQRFQDFLLEQMHPVQGQIELGHIRVWLGGMFHPGLLA